MNDIATFDPKALQKRVVDAIQTNFGMLIPQEKFDEMVSAAIMEFFENPAITELREMDYVVNPSADHWNQRKGTKLVPVVMIPPFKLMVWREVHTLVAKELEAFFAREQNALKATVASTFSEASFKDLSDKNIMVISKKMAEVQHARATLMSLEMFKNNLMQVFNQNNAYEVANQIGKMPTPTVEDFLR
jgi:hypothetical protein